MDQLVTSMKQNNNKVEIFGEDNQGLQVILSPHEGIVINKQLLSYFTPDIKSYSYLKFQNNIVEKSSELSEIEYEKITSEDLEYYYNDTNSLQYLGLSNYGKILKVNIFLYKLVFINHKYLVAFDSNIHLYTLPRIKKLYLEEFVPIIKKRFLLNDYNSRKIIFDKLFTFYYCSYDSKACISSNSSLLNNSYAYLQSPNLLIEKRLGKDETIIVNKNGIALFEVSCCFKNIMNTEHTNKESLIKVIGPGLIIYEATKIEIDRKMHFKTSVGEFMKINIKSLIWNSIIIAIILMFLKSEILSEFIK